MRVRSAARSPRREISLASCEELPFADSTFDVIIGLELVEHISFLDEFAREIHRLLKPGGLAIISTPPRIRSVIEGEPHWGIKGLALLPFALQRPIAEKVFGKSYPFPITRQFCFSSSVLRPFVRLGLEGYPLLTGTLDRVFRKSGYLHRFLASIMWNFLLVKKKLS